jgi:hypothetical protein
MFRGEDSSMNTTSRAILNAILVCGSLDIASAFVFAGLRGGGPLTVLHSVASGPFGQGVAAGGVATALLGLAVHFAIMAVMAAVFVTAVRRLPFVAANPLVAGIAYGLALYLLMYWIVLPLRWPASFPSVNPVGVASALFSHIVCVGIPMAYVTQRSLGLDRIEPLPAG